jgi:hypothetical protein
MTLIRSSRIASALAIIIFSVLRVQAAQVPKYYFSLDYFLPGNIQKSLDEPQQDINEDIISQGGTPVPSKKSSGAFGGRLGLLVPLKGFDGYWIGGNLGYVKGPKAKLTDNDPSVPPGTITFEEENSYWRGLVDIAHISDINKKLAFKFDVGVGLGKGKTTQKRKNQGFYEGVFADSDFSQSSSLNFTWEISPALILKEDRFDVEFGVRYSQFPVIKGSDTTYEVDYSAFGFYTGIDF